MNRPFLEQDSILANKKRRNMLIVFLVIFIIAATVLFFSGLFDSSEESGRLVPIFGGVAGIFLLFLVIGLVKAMKACKKGENLILPFNENPEAAAQIINSEIADGKTLVDEYDDVYPDGKKPYVKRIMLLPSYLLLFNGMGKITAIPRDKIYCVFPQAGIKGRSSFVARLIVFTELKAFFFEGFETIDAVADKIYQYIPNCFTDCDPFPFSYELLEIYEKNRGDFLKLFEEKKSEGYNV